MSAETDARREAAKKAVDVLMEISTLLNTGLNRSQLSICISMIEHGTNPEALAAVIKDLRKEAERIELAKGQRSQTERSGEEKSQDEFTSAEES